MKTNTPEYARKLRKFHEFDRAFWATIIAAMLFDTPYAGLDMVMTVALIVSSVALWWLAHRLDKELDAMEREE